MAVQSTPYVETALSHSSELFRRELQSGLPIGSAGGVVPATPAASANLSAGVAGCSDLAVSAGSGMSVNVNAGQGIVPGSLGSTTGYGIGTGYGYPAITTNGASAPTISSTAAATKINLTTQGAYYVYNDDSAGAVNLAVSASNPTNPRIDVVGMQVEDAQYSGSNNDWKLTVITGTAASSPTVPSFPANFVPLAILWIAANASTVTGVVDVRVAYNRNPFRAEAYRNGAWTTATSGTFIMDTVYSNLDGAYNTSTGLYTLPVGGVYHCTVQMRYTATATTQTGSISITSSGADTMFGPVWVAGTTAASSASVLNTGFIIGAAGSTITLTEAFSTAGLTGYAGLSGTFLKYALLSPL